MATKHGQSCRPSLKPLWVFQLDQVSAIAAVYFVECRAKLSPVSVTQKVESKSWIKPLIVFGSVPMFFYIVHLYVLKVLYLIAVTVWHAPHGEYFGVDHVSTLWLISIILTVALYPLMLKFFKHKKQNTFVFFRL